MAPGDEVTVTIDGRRVRGHVLYVRGDSVRVELPGGSVTRPMSKVKPVRKQAPATPKVAKTRDRVAMPCCMGLAARGICTCKDVEPPWAVRPVPKPPKPLRDAEYLSFVREHECCARRFGSPCAGGVVAHHHGPRGTGQKTDDYRCVPLCDGHHREFHDRGSIGLLDRDTLDSIFAEKMRAMLLEWVGTIDGDPVIVDALIEHIQRSQR